MTKTLQITAFALMLTMFVGADAAFAQYGGGGGGSRSGQRTRAVVTTTVTTPAPVGQVLGAATYNFTTDLTIGSRGADVTELQAQLIAGGFLVIDAPTGYFGPLTRDAVAKWQAANGVAPAAGYFGPISRAKYVGGASIAPATATTTTSTTTSAQ